MKMKITLHGVAYEVEVEVLDEGEGFYGANAAVPQVPRVIQSSPAPAYNTSPAAHHAPHHGPASSSDKAVTSPVGGTIVEVKLRNGDKVTKGQEILVLEAMKMEIPVVAPSDGTVASIEVKEGDPVEVGYLIATMN